MRADPGAILTDIVGYAPWKMPFRLGRLTAAAAVTMVLLLLGAEAWEVGVNIRPLSVLGGALLAVFAATVFLFFGQNLGQIARGRLYREQMMRTRIVLFATLLIGMAALWVVLFGIGFLATLCVPSAVSSRWLSQTLEVGERARYAAFLASLGALAGALGGNLENEDDLKARLLFDEET